MRLGERELRKRDWEEGERKEGQGIVGYEVTPIIAYRGDNTAYLKMTSHKTFS